MDEWASLHHSWMYGFHSYSREKRAVRLLQGREMADPTVVVARMTNQLPALSILFIGERGCNDTPSRKDNIIEAGGHDACKSEQSEKSANGRRRVF